MAFDIPAVKTELKRRIVDLSQTLAPGGSFDGVYYRPRNPTRTDRKAGSFFIWVKGAKIGAWVESVSGETGDVIDLIAYCMGFAGRGDALHWAAKWLEGQAVSCPDPTRPEEKSGENERPEQSDAEKRQAAAAWFAKGMGIQWAGLAKSYLKGRGIELEQWPSSLRFFKSMKHGFSGQSFPCIMAAYTNHKQEIVGVHRTYLAKDGGGKAPVDPVRLSWPAGFGGSVVRINAGECRTLVIVEGLEDALSVTMACPWAGVWMAGALWNIERLRLPKAEQVIIFADNDWGKPEAEALLDRATNAFRRQGRSIYIARSPLGKDANDALVKGGASVVESAIYEAEIV